MINTKDIMSILPKTIQSIIEGTKDSMKLEEIRLKVNKPLILYVGNAEVVHKYIVSVEDIKMIINKMSSYSIYAFEEEMRQGYITINGGHRVGICGNYIVENSMIKTIKDISSVNIRFSKEIIGCSNWIMPYIINGDRVLNTIVISPPKCGKTTLIRDITRNISSGMGSISFEGKKVCVIDERSEIGACCNGVPQMELGIRTDILDACPKSEGIMISIRSMSPDVIICDEIGTHKDIESILMALNSGVSIITTIHGYDIEDIYKRAVFTELIENHVFKRAVILSSLKGAGTIEYIHDFDKKDVVWRR